MLHPVPSIKKILTISIAMLLILLPGSAAYAEEPASCTPPSSTQNGVHWPTGADSSTFTYQCDGPNAGKWVNAYYLYDPATNSRVALYSPSYNYDCAAQQWYMTTWEFSAASGSYFQSTVASNDPGLATDCPAPPAPATNDPIPSPSPSNNAAGDTKDESQTHDGLLFPGQGNNSLTTTGNNSIGFGNTTGATMHNGVISFANTGDANILGNTQAGSASSGDASVIANIINMLQSSSNVLGDPNLITFTADINGDVNGDLLLDPAVLQAIQPANSSTNLDNNLAVNNSSDAAITNDIALGAGSGDATVAQNSSAGDASTGNANAVANIVNVLNSAVTAGKSFLGVVNINGNLNGDILLPPNFIDTLIASNVPRYSVDTTINNNASLTNNTNQSIANAVTADAKSGSANVLNNTSAGSAQTGAARTNITVFNLTGSTVVASNDLLVFVNVLGSWYGLILNAPAGATAASLGGGVIENTTVNNNFTMDNNTNQSITNNVKVGAETGDALVAENTKAGNSKSGDATASVNLMNMINNNISLNGWFGILFINVFGTWHGSFGVNTAAGDPVNIPNPVAEASQDADQPQMFRFVSTALGSNSALPTSPLSFYANTEDSSTDGTSSPEMVLASHITNNPIAKAASQAPDAVRRNYQIMFIGASLAFLILVYGERHRIFRRHYSKMSA